MTEETPVTRPKKVLKPKFHLPSDNLTVEKQLKVLRSFVAASDRGAKAVNYKDVAGFSGFGKTNVSSCNKFFEESGMIVVQKRGNYVPHKRIIDYADVYDHNEEEAAGFLREIVAKTWFGELALARLSVDKNIPKESLIKSLGSEMGGELSRRAKRGINALVEYLEVSKTVQVDSEGQVRMGEEIGEVPKAHPEAPKIPLPIKIKTEDIEELMESRGLPPLGVSVNVQIDTSGWELKDIRSLLRLLRGEDAGKEDDK